MFSKANPVDVIRYMTRFALGAIFLASPLAWAEGPLIAQTIAFDAIPSQIFGVSPFPIAAEASSGLAVSFASTTPAVCKNSDDLVMLLGVGTCSITASQGGNASYSAAPPVTRSFTVSLAKPSGSFTATVGGPFPTGTTPVSVAKADFNGDGIPDLAIANINGNNVTVLLGNGSGGFTAALGSPFTVGTNPYSVAVGDFNGDGFPDLATANQGSNNVTVLLGNGLGGFTAALGSPIAAGSYPISVAVGDFNGDGVQDLAVADRIDNTITVLLGNGSGGFAPATSSPFAAGTTPWSLVVGDFNGDGVLDLAVANAGGFVSVFLGNGLAGFSAGPGSPFTVGVHLLCLAVGDFNGDGFQDLATADANNNNVIVLLGNGLGGFTGAAGGSLPAGTSARSVAVGDFNGDGIPDLAVAGELTNDLIVMLGNGLGGFTAITGSPFATGVEPTSVAVGDFTGDGIEDVALANAGDNTVTMLLGLVVGHTTQTITFGTLANVMYGVPPFAIGATASSGLAVSFASTTSSVCTVTGTTVTVVGSGVCSIVASQAGNAAYAAAATVAQSFTVSALLSAFFTGQVSVGNSVYYLAFPDNNLFGYYSYLSGGWIYHFDMGYEYVDPGAGTAVYLYDLSSGHWWYTSASLFPYLYDFTLNTWIYYFPNTTSAGHYTTNPRYFANPATGAIFTM